MDARGSARSATLWVVMTAGCATSAWARDEPALLPAAATLAGSDARQRFLVETRDASGVWTGDATSRAVFYLDDPRVARVDGEGVVTPVGDGSATLRATIDGKTLTARVRVERALEALPGSFRGRVLPILAKAGCNSGACHGAAAGKNGFRLTLRGYGPETDYDVITRQARGRRVNMSSPAESLILLKPTGVLEHGGGVRLAAGSVEYRALADWVAEGAPGPRAEDPRVTGLRVEPEASRLRPGSSQTYLVWAKYSDGRTADVTRWAKFTTSDASVAKVDDDGHARVEGRGECAINVWFASFVARATLTSPYDPPSDRKVFARAPRSNEIDVKNLAKLESLGIPPSGRATDAAWLRRARLDATGVTPSIRELDAYLADKDVDKRAQMVDRLVNSPEYVDYWTYKWSDLMLVSTQRLAKPAMWSLHRFVRASVAENVGWDVFARRIVTATGSTLENGAAGFYVLHRDANDLVESTSMAFLGMSLMCARCHNHPLEKWTQDQYYGMASLFARVRLKDGARPGEVIVVADDDGEAVHPRKGVPMRPQPLDGVALDPKSTADRRVALADWLARADNPYFARAVVNRVWTNFFGRGLVDPEDDLRATNPPADAALLDWLVKDFIEHKYDVKHLIVLIMNSEVYARASAPLAQNAFDARYLSRYPVKRLAAEVLLDAAARVTEVPDAFAGYPAGWRSLQLPDSKVESAFLDSFGRAERLNTCSCERSSEPSTAQALQLANGSTINDKLRSDRGVVARLIRERAGDALIVEGLFASALARPATDREKARFVEALRTAAAGAKDEKEALERRRHAVEDAYWAVLTSDEFIFNH